MDNRRTQHAAYDNDCKYLGDAETVLALVKKRLAKEEAGSKKKERPLVLGFADQEKDDVDMMRWEFVRTAEPEFKKVLIADLKKGEVWERERTIYNLVSYPGKETVDLIKPFLTDNETDKTEIGRDRTKVTIYPLRQMAYYALQLLGEPVAKPQGYVPEARAWLMDCGFESRDYFPYGDWKQLDNN